MTPRGRHKRIMKMLPVRQATAPSRSRLRLTEPQLQAEPRPLGSARRPHVYFRGRLRLVHPGISSVIFGGACFSLPSERSSDRPLHLPAEMGYPCPLSRRYTSRLPPLSYSRGAAAPLLEKTISQTVADTAASFPEREALVVCHQNIRLTWSELDLEVTGVARGLAGLGLGPGDRAGIWASNCLEWILLQHAAGRAGVVLVNVNPAYRSHELRYVLQKSRIRALFLRERDTRANYRDILAAVQEEPRDGAILPLEHVIWLGDSSWDAMLAGGRDFPPARRKRTLLLRTVPDSASPSMSASPGNRVKVQCSLAPQSGSLLPLWSTRAPQTCRIIRVRVSCPSTMNASAEPPATS